MRGGAIGLVAWLLVSCGVTEEFPVNFEQALAKSSSAIIQLPASFPSFARMRQKSQTVIVGTVAGVQTEEANEMLPGRVPVAVFVKPEKIYLRKPELPVVMFFFVNADAVKSITQVFSSGRKVVLLGGLRDDEEPGNFVAYSQGTILEAPNGKLVTFGVPKEKNLIAKFSGLPQLQAALANLKPVT